jgi:hypothetical protein
MLRSAETDDKLADMINQVSFVLRNTATQSHSTLLRCKYYILVTLPRVSLPLRKDVRP